MVDLEESATRDRPKGTHHDSRATATQAGPDPSHGSWRVIQLGRVPRSSRRARHPMQHESAWPVPRQRCGRKLLPHVEDRMDLSAQYETRREARLATFEYIEAFYNSILPGQDQTAESACYASTRPGVRGGRDHEEFRFCSTSSLRSDGGVRVGQRPRRHLRNRIHSPAAPGRPNKMTPATPIARPFSSGGGLTTATKAAAIQKRQIRI